MKRILFIASCLAVAFCMMAQDRFYIEDFTINPGETQEVAIMLDNITVFSAIQADIYLPEGLSIEKEDGEYIFDLTERKARNHTASSALLSSGAIRLLIASQTSRTFSGNSGALVTFQLTASSDFVGPKTIVMNNIIASEADMTQHDLPSETCIVSTPGGEVITPTQSLELNCKMAKLIPDAKLQLIVTTSEVGTITWTSEDESVATVDQNGLVTAVNPGMVAINATTVNGASAWCAIWCYLRGDVDEDGETNISDVTSLIDYLLSNKWPDENIQPDTPGPNEPSSSSVTYTVNGVSFTMISVEGGTFTMGATPEQGTSALDSEKPAHEVTVSSFSIGQTEVTQALWIAVMGSNPSSFTGDSKRPVECVSWNDCQTFIAQLNQITGLNFRLPTEAEWEFAARGGNKSQGYKFAGSDNVDDVAWYKANIPSQTSSTEGYGTQPVATKAPNELALYDMSGNVWEWCQDWYGTYSSDEQINPTGPVTGSTRVVHGGSWYNSNATSCRISRRNGCFVTDADTYLGLRLAM